MFLVSWDVWWTDQQQHTFLPRTSLFSSVLFHESSTLTSEARLQNCVNRWCSWLRPEGFGFDSRWFLWNMSLTQSFQPHYGTGVDSTSTRNELPGIFDGCKGGRYVGLTTLPSSYVDCLEIWEPQPSGTLRVCPGLYWDCFTVICLSIWRCLLIHAKLVSCCLGLTGHVFISNRSLLCSSV